MLGLVDDDRAGLSQRDMEPCLVIVYSYPTSRVYTCWFRGMSVGGSFRRV